MGPTLSKGTLEEVYMFVIIYMPFIIIYSCFLVVLMSQLWAPILASISILPSGTRYYTSRFFGAVQRRASYCLSPLSVKLLIQTSVAQRRPIDRIIYHSVAFALLLLLLTWNVWIVLFLCFVDVLAEDDLLPPLLFKIVLYITMILLSISPWFFAATSGKLEEMRWWPTRDHLSRLVPSSIANATVTKCRWKSLYSSWALWRESSSHPETSEDSSSSWLFHSLQSLHMSPSPLCRILPCFPIDGFRRFLCVTSQHELFQLNRPSSHSACGHASGI